MAASWHLVTAHKHNAELRDEIARLQRRLADRRAMVTRQRDEMAEVASAVDRLGRTVSVVRDRERQARRLAHMEESRDSSDE